jgi:glucose dehydrogenase
LTQAIDAKTGKLLWTFNSIPQDATDPYWDLAGPTWKGGGGRIGGATWQTPAIDPELGLLFVCTANQIPQHNGSLIHGLNLFTDSLLALDLKTGLLKEGWGFDYTGDGKGDGFFQAVHHDVWDYDWAQNPVLYDANIDGQIVKALATSNKNGLVYMFDRTTGKALPGTTIQEVPVQAWSNVPGEEMWPTQPFQFNKFGQIMNNCPLIGTDIPQARLDAGYVIAPPYTPPFTFRNAAGQERTIMAPNFQSGGQTGAPASCSPKTGLLYFGAIDSPTNGGRPGRAFVTAFDQNTGVLVWQKVVSSNISAGTGSIATAGDLVFIGESNGLFHAFDARTGEEVWNFYTGGNLKGSPITYMLNGKQYVSVKSLTTLFTFALSE